eukprot:GHVP01006150.1.p1 GENE.GHVP01006150.1~~GHVP01006150.1.p1  ORF type:complete len:136 (-),score=24.89 GHVP01006150.1:460-867(-)
MELTPNNLERGTDIPDRNKLLFNIFVDKNFQFPELEDSKVLEKDKEDFQKIQDVLQNQRNESMIEVLYVDPEKAKKMGFGPRTATGGCVIQECGNVTSMWLEKESALKAAGKYEHPNSHKRFHYADSESETESEF